MTSLVARIVLRYVIGMLVAYALITNEIGEEFTRDPELAAVIEAGIGAVCAGIVEGWTLLARRWGWKT